MKTKQPEPDYIVQLKTLLKEKTTAVCIKITDMPLLHELYWNKIIWTVRQDKDYFVVRYNDKYGNDAKTRQFIKYGRIMGK
jgi:hypothetical protein